MKSVRQLLLAFFAFTVLTGLSQNETTKWYFGFYAGLDFSSGSPVSVVSPSMHAVENSSSIADAAGNLLFYTNSETIWNSSHAVMANGSGILGNWSTTQSIVVKQPGSSSIYHLFTSDDAGGPDGFRYSTIDMSLAAGMGSVTTKNILLFTPSSEKISAVRHCNGSDVWIIAHDRTGDGFKTFLVTSAGVNTTPVITNIGPNYQGSSWSGFMRFSPNGRKLAVSATDWYFPYYELYDFDNTTGIMSAPQTLSVSNSTSLGSCEFSPDGTKLYAIVTLSSTVVQWDLCANNATTVVQSQFTGMNNYFGGIQMGPDKKIYLSRAGNTTLGVINNPNAAGIAFNYSDSGPVLLPNGLVQPTGVMGLPSFLPHHFKQLPAFTFTSNCQSVSFTAPTQLCSVSGSSFTSFSWDFADPNTGAANQSTLANPVHIYSSSGIHHPKLILYYPCSTDTITLPVNLTNAAPDMSVSGSYALCRGETRTFTVNGADTYTWSNGASGASASISPTISTIYTVNGTNSLTGCTSQKSFTVVVFPCTGINANNAQNNAPLIIYPNPYQQTITFFSDKAAKFFVVDQLGKIIFEAPAISGENTFDLGKLSSGMYTVKLVTESSQNIGRLVRID